MTWSHGNTESRNFKKQKGNFKINKTFFSLQKVFKNAAHEENKKYTK